MQKREPQPSHKVVGMGPWRGNTGTTSDSMEILSPARKERKVDSERKKE